MNAITASGVHLTTALGEANTLAGSVWSTVTGQAGWWILIATAGIIVGLAYFLLRRLRRLGRG